MSNRWFTGRILTVAALFGLSGMQPMASSAVQAHNTGAGDKAPSCTLGSGSRHIGRLRAASSDAHSKQG